MTSLVRAQAQRAGQLAACCGDIGGNIYMYMCMLFSINSVKIMNADVARLLAQVCTQYGIRPQLVVPSVNATNVTTQVSLPKPSQASTQGQTSTATLAPTRIAPATCANSSSSTSSGPQGSHVTNTKCASVDLAIKVINPKCKREAKTYILHSISVSNITTLKRLKVIILEQLGKSVVSFQLGFDVGYIVSGNRICFSQSDDVKTELEKIVKKGYALWCEGLDPGAQKRRHEPDGVVLLDDSDDDCPTGKPPAKRDKKSAFEERKDVVQKIADKLHSKHGSTLNMVQYKLWAEALYSKQYTSWDEPPKGLPWGDDKKNKFKSKEGASTGTAANVMMHSFANMATSIAGVISKSSHSSSTPQQSSPTSPEGNASVRSSVGISPGRKIDLQEKLLKQVDLLHQMFERGAITVDQFELRRESIMKQLESLDCD